MSNETRYFRADYLFLGANSGVSHTKEFSHKRKEKMEIRNAIITYAQIELCNGCLTVNIILDYDEGSQNFGGLALQGPYCGHFIQRVFEVAGVTRWQDLVGKSVRSECDHSHIRAIGHIIKDIWFNPESDFERMFKEREKENV